MEGNTRESNSKSRKNEKLRGVILGKFFFSPVISVAVLIFVLALLTWLAIRVCERGEEVDA